MKKNEEFALIKYSSYNIGDDIQSIAAKRFLPRIDNYIQRERSNLFKGRNKNKLIMNAWWMWNVKNFPPSDDINPLLISMYIREEIRDNLVNGKVRDYFLKYGPVGCRDTSTAEYLNSINIPAYFSGCLTLTLLPNPEIKKENFILAIDVDDSVIEKIRTKTDIPVYSMSRMLSPYFSSLNRLEIAELVLYLYQSAHCVVSPCLHVVLPCLALGTNVLRIDTGDSTGGPEHSTGHAQARFSGMEDLIHTVKLKEFLVGNYTYDFNLPPSNPTKYHEIALNLSKKCFDFTGYDNDESLIKADKPLLRVLQILQEDKSLEEKAPYFTSMKNIIKHVVNRVLFRKSRFDF